MTRPRNSLSTMYRNNVTRPMISGALSSSAGVRYTDNLHPLRIPLMSFFEETTRQNNYDGVPVVMPEHSTQYPTVQYGSQGETEAPSRSSRPRTTGYEYRPFSEPYREPDPWSD